MRTITDTTDTLQWMLSDHLGSTSTTANADGRGTAASAILLLASQGKQRITASDFRYTGQLRQAELGLYYYVAGGTTFILTGGRSLTPLYRTIQSSGLESLSYVRNNPINYSDPNGHRECGALFPGDWIDERTINTIGDDWDIQNQKKKSKRTEAILTGIVKIELGLVSPILTIGFQTINDENISLIDVAFASSPIIKSSGIADDALRFLNQSDESSGLIRVIREDMLGTSQGFKLRAGEDGLSVFEGVRPDQVLAELPGVKVPNTVVIIPRIGLPLGTQIIKTPAETLSTLLSDAHRILVPPNGWSIDRFAKVLKTLVGW